MTPTQQILADTLAQLTIAQEGVQSLIQAVADKVITEDEAITELSTIQENLRI
jgi:hypothetical protein